MRVQFSLGLATLSLLSACQTAPPAAPAAGAAAVVAARDQKTADSSKDFDKLVVELAQIVRERLSLSGGPECPVGAPGGECTIQMTQIHYLGRPYCIAEAPYVRVTETSSKTKFINWTLDRTSFGGKPIQFHHEAGVVIVDERKHDLIDTTPSSRGHGNGDVVSVPIPKHKFHIKTNRKISEGNVSYLPVVLWDRTGLGDWELCAGIDPKIVNVP